MQLTTNERNKAVTDLLNATFTSLDTVVPVQYSRQKPTLLAKEFHLEYGVLIGITGDIQGKLVLSGDPEVFSAIGETMYGMSLEGEMLISFSGELGNMIAGGLSTNIITEGISLNITSPTMMQGNTKILGFKQGIDVTVTFTDIGDMTVYLLLD
ncbi:chemotaxis protein CheX [Lentibacillus cibarius]|uniref:Chemotaxis protein CheX n=1 Tax=Lentibacillus cibarius TaxID=2583219 RepID=A0A549YEH4_9BACI|nr:chemotaxis protein CheX [Lentibacillus cibarius]TMN21395.1 chemotaxis protein CheX [Lentibacillus cibarius]TRM10274.1 chemotaxis protein CheX [Lentibacillus cibarius]